jgi:hypothetical protein
VNNDSADFAKKLARLLSDISCKINLIPFNPFDGSSYKRSTKKSIDQFKSILINKGFITTLRITRGDAIDGACGQLVGKLNNSIKSKKPGRFSRPYKININKNHDYNFRKTRKRKLLGAILCVDYFN